MWAIVLLVVGGLVVAVVVGSAVVYVWVSGLGAADLGEPPARIVATAYNLEIDGDAAQELVVAFEAFDAAGNPTTCRCAVAIDLGDETTASWTEVLADEAQPEEFGNVTLGEGVAQRTALVWSTVLDDRALAPTCTSRSIFDVRVRVRGDSFGELSDAAFAYCR